jgi:ectoine hydroxylase-related dioxygenase (phytanoyl-CoA dioxygenase family)
VCHPPQVRAALEEALSTLNAVLGGSVGVNAELFELSALVSDPRAPRQPVHPDTPFKAGDGAAIVTTFVALQDVDETMGPTGFIPQTHTSEAHARFNTKDDGGRERVALLRERPNHVGILSIGGANLIDSRLFHCMLIASLIAC